MNLFKYICKNKEIVIKDNLQHIIPIVSDQMISTKKEICDLSKEVMLLICKTSGNKDIEPFIEDIIKSVVSPDDVIKCINGLASTIFASAVYNAALSELFCDMLLLYNVYFDFTTSSLQTTNNIKYNMNNEHIDLSL